MAGDAVIRERLQSGEGGWPKWPNWVVRGMHFDRPLRVAAVAIRHLLPDWMYTLYPACTVTMTECSRWSSTRGIIWSPCSTPSTITLVTPARVCTTAMW